MTYANPPVIGGHPKNHSGRLNKPIDRVVIHSAVMPNTVGAARRLAEWNRTGATGGSWHYAVDADEAFQTSFDSYVCWHAPPNPHSVGIEMADMPSRLVARWLTPRHRQMLRRTARLTAELCLDYDIPPVLLTVEGCRAGRRGIATHDTVSKAFGQSTHWDPGAWPSAKFLRLVRKHIAHLQEGTK